MLKSQPNHDRRSATETFNRLAAEYRFWMRQKHESYLSDGLSNLATGKRMVLDVGCGDGALTMHLAKVAHHVVGVDISPVMISHARKHAMQSGCTNVDFIIGDIQALGFADDCFDLIVSSFALHHTDQNMTVPLLAGLLRPEGWLYFQEPVCPVTENWVRRLWFHQQGFRDAISIMRLHGMDAAWRVTRFLQSRTWIRHQLEDDHKTPPEAQALYRSLLPGSVIRHMNHPPAIMVLWQRPPAESQTDGPPLRQRRAQEPAFNEPDLPSQQGTIHVQRRYPHPPPAGYIPFPPMAIDGSVIDRFEEQVRHHEQKVAIRTIHGELTYGGLNAAANRLARRVLAAAGSATSPVVILMDQDDPVIPAIIGVLKAGKAYIVVDPADPPERLEQIFSLSGAIMAMTTANRLKTLDQIPSRPRQLLVVEEAKGDAVSDNVGLAIAPDQLAAVFFTSGSTGTPKGVMRDHRQFLHSTWLNTNTYYVSPEDRQSLLYFPGFTASVPNIYDTLLNGATLCSLNPRNRSPFELLEWLRCERITHFNPSVGLFHSLIAAIPGNTLGWPDLRLITLAGQTIYGKDVRDFQSRFGVESVLLYVLAMTEGGAITQGFIDHDTEFSDGPVPAGYPVADKVISILGDDHTPVLPDEVGQIAVTSRYLSMGYWGDEEKTKGKFLPIQENSYQRTYLTGDRGRLRPDGCLEYFGREDSLVKLRGYRIDLEAVEAVINSYPEIRSAAVVTHRRTDGEQRMIAYLVPGLAGDISIPDLRTFLSKELTSYMIPHRFIQIPEMPLTTSGKMDRANLPKPTAARHDLETPFAAPRSILEQQIACIWAELLELDEVGIHDNFFELGGDSLTVLHLALIVEKAHGTRISDQFFQNPTVAHMMSLLDHDSSIMTDPSDTRSHQGMPERSAGQNRLTVRERVRYRLFHTGPVVRGRCLVHYGMGVRLQRAWLKMPGVREKLFRSKIELLRRWHTETGALADFEDVLTVNLMANTWRIWRNLALSDPDELVRWITITGESSRLLGKSEHSRGVVVAMPHAGFLMERLAQICLINGRPTAMIANVKNISMQDKNFWLTRQMQARSIRMLQASDVLKRNGVVLVAADGQQSRQKILAPFRGRRRPFAIGAADLALRTGSLFVPAFVYLNAHGQVQVNMTPHLTAQSSTLEEQCIELTEKYAALYSNYWPELYPSMDWTHLAFNLNLPPDPDSRGNHP